MNVLKVDTNNNISVVEITDVYADLGQLLGGTVEHVRPMRLRRPYCLMVDDEGLMKELPVNAVGSWFYQSDLHGHPIVGDIFIMKEVGDPYEIRGLSDQDTTILQVGIEAIIRQLERVNKGCETDGK